MPKEYEEDRVTKAVLLTLESAKKPLKTEEIQKVLEEIDCPDQIKFEVINHLKNEISSKYDDVNTLDGIRVNTDEGWVLIRASNTSPIIRLTVEADDENILNNMVKRFYNKTIEFVEKIGNL